MFGGNDLKMALTLRYSVKWTQFANSNIGFLISKLYHSILKTPNNVHPPPSHPIQHPLQLHGIVKRMLAFMHENFLLQTFTCLLAVKNFSNYRDDDKSYVKLIQSKARGHDQMKVIFDNYTKVSPLKESTPCRDNSKEIRSNIVDDSKCIRLLYLGQNVFDMRTAENLVTVTRNDVKTNSDCPVSTGVSITKEANSRMIQHVVEVAETY